MVFWRSGEKRKEFLAFAKGALCEGEVKFIIAVDEYKAKPTWKLLDYIVVTYIDNALVDVTDRNAVEPLTQRARTDRNARPSPNVFDLGYAHIVSSLCGVYRRFETESKKQ